MTEPRVVFAVAGYQLLSNGTCKRDVMSTGRRMSYVPPRLIEAYIATRETALTEREERIAAQAKEIEALKQANASLASDIAKHISSAMRTVRP